MISPANAAAIHNKYSSAKYRFTSYWPALGRACWPLIFDELAVALDSNVQQGLLHFLMVYTDNEPSRKLVLPIRTLTNIGVPAHNNHNR